MANQYHHLSVTVGGVGKEDRNDSILLNCPKTDCCKGSSMYMLSCFLKEEPSVLFPLLLPLGFKWRHDDSLVWQDRKTELVITPFSSKGRESMGYRVYFHGNPETLQYLFNRTFSCFSLIINGIEWNCKSSYTQSDLIRIAEKAGFRRGSLYGLYEHNGVGIVLLPNNEINLQIRNRSINARNLSRFLYEIEAVAENFHSDDFTLFTFEKGMSVV